VSDRRFTFAGADMIATMSGALFWPDTATLVVADMHLEKGTSRAKAGVLLPPYDSRATLAVLAGAIQRWQPERVIALGDSFHDAGAGGRLDAADRHGLAGLIEGRDWIWIAGNHDPAPPPAIGGRIATVLTLGPLVFRHQAGDEATVGEVSGHYHPKAVVRVAGGRISTRCFVTDGRRLILPAFGAFTGGLSIDDEAIRSRLGSGCTAYALGHRRVHVIPVLGTAGARTCRR
jgi:uncharacterized protein